MKRIAAEIVSELALFDFFDKNCFLCLYNFYIKIFVMLKLSHKNLDFYKFFLELVKQIYTYTKSFLKKGTIRFS